MIQAILGLLVFALLALVGILVILLGFPGTLLIVLGAVAYDLITWSLDISGTTIIILLGLTLLGEIFDIITSGIAVRRSGSSMIGVLGAAFGGIVGGLVGLPIPVIGSVLGVFAGAFIGAFLFELVHLHNVKKAWSAGLGAFVGRMVSMFIKLALAAVMIVMVAWAVLF